MPPQVPLYKGLQERRGASVKLPGRAGREVKNMDRQTSNIILIVLAAIGAVAVVAVLGMLLMHTTMMGGGGMMGGAGMMGCCGGMMWLWPVGLLVIVALVALLLIRRRPRL
jgi:uncharacterized membrane protein